MNKVGDQVYEDVKENCEILNGKVSESIYQRNRIEGRDEERSVVVICDVAVYVNVYSINQ